MEFSSVLTNIRTDIDYMKNGYIPSEANDLLQAYTTFETDYNNLLNSRTWNSSGKSGFNNFSFEDVSNIINKLDNVISLISSETTDICKINPDTPIFFELNDLIPYLEQLAENQGGNILQFVQMLSLRMRFLFADERLNGVVQPTDDISLIEWLNLYIGANDAENGQITLIDLSLIPSDIIHIVVAVLSRLTFEAVQRYRKINKQELPTTIVLEEAHTFLQDFGTNGNICLETFERIAREGQENLD